MKRALIIEADPGHAEHLAGLLRARGIRPVQAGTGQSSLTLAHMTQPDLILLDENLPDINGLDLCRRLRCDDRLMAAPVILLIDLDSSTIRRRGFRVGANAHLAKPFEPEQVDAALATARAWRERLIADGLRGEVVLELNSQAEFLADVNEFLTELSRRTPLSIEQIGQLRQAFLEMGLNAIEWGNRRQPEQLVRVIFQIFADRVEITVRDQGAGFDPADLPHAATTDDPLAHLDVRERLGLRVGGFGLLIARGMLDELRHNERGNEVTLIKRFPSVPAPGPSAHPTTTTATAPANATIPPPPATPVASGPTTAQPARVPGSAPR